MQTGNTNYIYNNDLDEACFRHHMGYVEYKDLTKRKQSDKVCKDKVFKIASNPKYDRYQRGLLLMIYNFLIKNLQVVVLNLCQINNLQMNFINQLLAKNFKKSLFFI